MNVGEDTIDIPNIDLGQLRVISALGRGAKGVVFLVRKGDESLALKVILRVSITKKKKSGEDEYKRICFEQEVLRRCQHPLLPKLRGVLSTDSIVGYAIDYCPGRDLNYVRKRQTEKMFSVDVIRFYAAELVLALEYLHGLGIVYRDLKPENVMVQENGHLMLVDFDLSTKLSPKRRASLPKIKPLPESSPATKKKNAFPSFYNCCHAGISPEDSVHPAEFDDNSATCSEFDSASKTNSFVGTEEYVAPEMIEGNGHDFAVDWWCLGVVLYEMLYGATPFKGVNRKETFYRILSKSPELMGEPTPLRDLISKLLEKDPKQRITVEEIKGHDFFKGIDWVEIMRISRPPFVPGRFDEDERDTDGNKRIDIESFVQGVFKVDNDEANPKSMNNNNTNNDGGPNQADNFLIF